MNTTQVTKLDDNTLRIEDLLSRHTCRFVLNGEQIRLDDVEWSDGRAPRDAESVLEDMWDQARRHAATRFRLRA